MCVHVLECVSLPFFVRMFVSQGTEVVAGTGLLAEDLASPMAAHLPVAAPVPVSGVRARYEPRQEAFRPTGQAFPAACSEVTVGPAGAHAVAPRRSNGRLQQLVGAVVQGG